MAWTRGSFPDQMKDLADDVREKAIEIANSLKDKGYEDARAISEGIAKAKQWAKDRLD